MDHRPVWYYMHDGKVTSWEEDPPCDEIRYWCREGDEKWTPVGDGPVPRLPKRKKKTRLSVNDDIEEFIE